MAWKVRTIFGNRMLFLTCSSRLHRYNKLVQLELKLEKIVGIWKHAGKVRKYRSFQVYGIPDFLGWPLFTKIVTQEYTTKILTSFTHLFLFFDWNHHIVSSCIFDHFFCFYIKQHKNIKMSLLYHNTHCNSLIKVYPKPVKVLSLPICLRVGRPGLAWSHASGSVG